MISKMLLSLEEAISYLCAKPAGTFINDGEAAAKNPSAAAENPSAAVNGPSSGAEWVELLVREMTNATSVDNAKDRASRVLEILEKSISARVGEETAGSFQKVGICVL